MDKLELIIFDMDGLMFDTERIAFLSWKEAASKYGYEMNEELFVKSIGANLEKTKQIYVQHFGEQCPIEIIAKERFEIAGRIIDSNGVSVKKGLNELLEYLSKLDVKKAVATSTDRERATQLLRMTNIYEYFDDIICGDEIEKCKPDPEIFLKVAGRLGCEPDRCMVLEDSEAGILAAYRAGMKPIMIPDMKEPNDATKKLAFKKMVSLLDVMLFLKESSNTGC